MAEVEAPQSEGVSAQRPREGKGGVSPASGQNGPPSQPPQGANGLPVRSLRDAVPHLRRPFTPEAVKFKIQVNPRGDNGRAMVVAYIDARLASERLNAVCPDQWGTEFFPVHPEHIEMGLTCRLTIGGVRRSDVGFARLTNSEGKYTDIGMKALYSDAFKRAAVHFGIGASLYSLPRSYIAAKNLKKVGNSWYLPDAVEGRLRQGYGRWLEQKAKRIFGEPLDHGDHELAQGDVEATEHGEPDSGDSTLLGDS